MQTHTCTHTQVFPQLMGDVVVPDFVGKLHSGPFLWVGCKTHFEVRVCVFVCVCLCV
jgi:hypothetical protein